MNDFASGGKCPHGKTCDEPCRRCEIEWLNEYLRYRTEQESYKEVGGLEPAPHSEKE